VGLGGVPFAELGRIAADEHSLPEFDPAAEGKVNFVEEEGH